MRHDPNGPPEKAGDTGGDTGGGQVAPPTGPGACEPLVLDAVAIAAMVTWLITCNHLWDRPSAHPRPGEAVLYNVATLATLTLGVSAMYAMLYAAALIGALAVIDTGYPQSRLGHPVGIVDSATPTWLASSLGIVAGALGTGLESEQAVRQATYSRREQGRQARDQLRDRGHDRGSRS